MQMGDSHLDGEKSLVAPVYKFQIAQVLGICTLFVTCTGVLIALVGAAIHYTRDTRGDSEQQAGKVQELCLKAIDASEARSRAGLTDLETRTTRSIADLEAREDRQTSQVAQAIGKRIDTIDSQVANLAKGKRW